MTNRVYKTDVLIIGGGLAGISTALELLEGGRRVLILDRDEKSAFGGLARWSFGGIFLVDSKEQRWGRIRDSPELAFSDWVRVGEIAPEDGLARDWARAYVENCERDVGQWLRERSIRFFPIVHWVERGWHVAGNSVPRFHMVWGTGHRLVEVLENETVLHPRADRFDVLFGHRIDGLQLTDGRVSGAHGTIESEQSEFRVDADCVVVASGGYCGSIDWLRVHWDEELGEAPDTILNGSHRFADGRLHAAAEAIGAEVANRERSWLYAAGVHHPAPRHEAHGLSIVPPRSALWLDKYGRRIGPEPLVSGFDTRHLVAGVCRAPGGYSWQVMNWRIACKELAVSGSEYNDAIRDRKPLAFIKAAVLGNSALVARLAEECTDVVVAHTLDELVAKMNRCAGSDDVTEAELRQTIETYDDVVAGGGGASGDEQLRRIAEMKRYRGDRARTAKSQRILDPKAMPLVAIREFVLSRKSMGGIRTDLGSRVLFRRDNQGSSVDRTFVPGLYAVGEAAGFGGGGIHGKRSLEGTFLGSCIFTGRVAAKTILKGG